MSYFIRLLYFIFYFGVIFNIDGFFYDRHYAVWIEKLVASSIVARKHLCALGKFATLKNARVPFVVPFSRLLLLGTNSI